MNKKNKGDFGTTIVFLAGFIIGIMIINAVSLVTSNFNEEAKPSIMYTSCFDQYDIEHLVKYEVPKYKVQEELNKPSINIYCPEI